MDNLNFQPHGLNDQFSIQEQRGYNSELFEVEYTTGGEYSDATSIRDRESKIEPISIPVVNTNTPLLSQNAPEPMQIAQAMNPMVTFIGLGSTGTSFEHGFTKSFTSTETPNNVNFPGSIYYLFRIETHIEEPSFIINYNITERENGEYIIADGDQTFDLNTADTNWQIVHRANKTYILGLLTIESDLIDERDGLITFTLKAGTGYRISTTAADNTATATITDNDLPIFTISGPASMNEETDVVYTVTTETGKIFADTSIVVNISQNPTVDDQLLYVGANMMGNKTETVTFLASDVTASKMVTVTTEDESGGTITATLATSTNGSYHLST